MDTNIKVTPINGKCDHLDSETFEASLKSRLSETCEYAKIYLFNQFPIVVSEEYFVDLLLIIALKDISGNYYRLEGNSQSMYLKNLIMPVTFISAYKDDKIIVEDDELLINDAEINFESEYYKIKRHLEDYLEKRCNIIDIDKNPDSYLNVEPLFFIKNKSRRISSPHLVAPEFTLKELEQYLIQLPKDKIVSNSEWLNSYHVAPYERITVDINNIAERASFDSKVGYLTKQKIDRIGRKVARSTKKEKAVTNSLVIISGKAGTGKSTELMSLMVKSLSKGHNALFLTYNKLLVFDLANISWAYIKEGKLSSSELGESSIMTLHAFFYRVSKRLGVLHVMSEDRIIELTDILWKRLAILFRYIKRLENDKYRLTNYDVLLESIQNHKKFSDGTKELGIDLIQYIRRFNRSLLDERDEIFIDFFNLKKDILEDIATNEIFLSDYYGVLKQTLDQINNPENYFDEKGIEDRGDLLKDIFKLKDKHFDGDKFKKGAFVEKKNRKIGGFRRKRTLFIDEAQDCHYLEKDILVNIFGHENIVVANGGAEQLIRHNKLCNWEYSQGENLNPKKYWTTNKSYRVKKHLLEFCMFIAQKYQIDLNLEPYDEEKDNPDIGNIIIDFRNKPSSKEVREIIRNLDENAKVHGCTNYESTLVMLESVGYLNKLSSGNKRKEPHRGVVNEYDNIEDEILYERDEWDLLKEQDPNTRNPFWDGTRKNKLEYGIPTFSQTRVIFYESCRGLEAWNAMCFGIDKFFEKKYEEPDAEKYLVGNETEVLTADMFLSNEDRKKMFAATWLLMATTRAMDSLYLQIEDKESEFGLTIQEFLNTSPSSVKVINNSEYV